MRVQGSLLLLVCLPVCLVGTLQAAPYTFDIFSVLGGSTSSAGINDLGQVTGFTRLSSGVYGFIYQDGVATTFAVPQAGAPNTLPAAINNLGVVAGTAIGSTGGNGFLYSQGAYTPFLYPAASNIFLTGINDSGEVIGVYFGAGNNFRSTGFYRDPDGTMHIFTGAFASTFVPTSVDNSGRIGGLLYGFGTTASGFYQDGVYTLLPSGYQLLAMNNVGQAAVYVQPSIAGGQAVAGSFGLMDSDGTLNTFSFPSSWAYSQISGLNDLGQLSGFAEQKLGSDTFSFVATPGATAEVDSTTPEPSGMLLVGTGLGILLVGAKQFAGSVGSRRR